METDDRGESILVVDDDLKYLKLIRALLRSEGYDVRTAADATTDRRCSHRLSSIQSRTEPKAFGVRCKAIFMNLLTRRHADILARRKAK